jgi:hypothetical protein
VAAVVRENGCVAGGEVEGAGCGGAEKDSCAAGAVEKVEPFCCVGVPVEFSVLLLSWVI